MKRFHTLCDFIFIQDDAICQEIICLPLVIIIIFIGIIYYSYCH